ncbi:MAG: hypothetical protein AB7N76_24890 [Planctomycetota bacterium]
MHDALKHLAKRIGGALTGVEELLRELERQSEREAKTLEEAEYGDDFDAELTTTQENVVAALNDAVRHVDAAASQLDEARRALEEGR